MVRNKDKQVDDILIKVGTCDLLIGTDHKNRFTLTPVCPVDSKGKPELSNELQALNELLRSEEVVLKPAKVKESEDK